MRNAATIRKSEYPILPLFLERWSSRVMSGEPLTHHEIMTLFEAARWAPSSFNEQPWRFIYALRDTPGWKKLFDLLVPANQKWAHTAAVLMVIISSKKFAYDNSPNAVHQFDAGSAWMSLTLQAQSMNLVAHGIAGFDFERARTELKIADNFTVCAMLAVGRPGSLTLQAEEEITLRNPISAIAQELFL